MVRDRLAGAAAPEGVTIRRLREDAEGRAADWRRSATLNARRLGRGRDRLRRRAVAPRSAADPDGDVGVARRRRRTAPWSAPPGPSSTRAPTSRRCGAAAPSRSTAAAASTRRWSSRRADEAAERGFRYLQVDASAGQPADPRAARPARPHVHDAVDVAAVASRHERTGGGGRRRRGRHVGGVAGQAAARRRRWRWSRSSAAPTRRTPPAASRTGSGATSSRSTSWSPAPPSSTAPTASTCGCGSEVDGARPRPARGRGARPRRRVDLPPRLRPARARDRRPAAAPGGARHRRRRRLRRADPRRRRAGARRAASTTPRRAVVVGGGYIGIEMAEAMVNRGLTVTVADPVGRADGHPRPGHGPAGARRRWRRWASTCAPRCALDGFETDADGRVRGRGDRRRRPFAADLVVLGTGVGPETTLARRGRAAPRPVGRAGHRPADAGLRRRGRVGGRRLRRVDRPGLRQPGARRARHPRQQAGPGAGHQPRRRLRDLPRRGRHGGQQGLRPRDRPHRAARGRLRRGRLPLADRRRSSRRPGPATSPARRRSP